MKKRLLSILLVVLFVAALLPLGGITAAAVSGTVYASDLSGDVALTGNTTVILDGGSNKVDSITGNYDLTFTGNGTLTVYNGIRVNNFTFDGYGDLYVYNETDDALVAAGAFKVTDGSIYAVSDADDGISAYTVKIISAFVDGIGGGSAGYGINCSGTVDIIDSFVYASGPHEGIDSNHSDILISADSQVEAYGNSFGLWASNYVQVSGDSSLYAYGGYTAVYARSRAIFDSGSRVLMETDDGVAVRAGEIQLWSPDAVQFPVGGYVSQDPDDSGKKVIVTSKRAYIADVVVLADGHIYCPSEYFDDVSTSDWFHHPVDWAVIHGVTGGTSEYTFSPNQTCTRAQTVTFLWAAAGRPDPGSVTNPFTDVKSSDWYYKAVLWAVQNGITGGTTPTTFSPNATVTRAQVATFLYAAVGKPSVSGSNPFKDVKSGDWFYKPVLWAVAEGVTGGTSPTTFSPNQGCTRAQIVTFLYALLGK